MTPAPLTSDEPGRLAALRRCDLLKPVEDPALDHLATLTARLLRAPVALVRPLVRAVDQAMPPKRGCTAIA